MMDLLTRFSEDMQQGPQWVYYWVNFMGLVFLLSIPFAFKRVEPRWIAISTLVLAPMIMFSLYAKFGYERVLGWGHIIAWAPALAYLWMRRSQWRVKETLTGKYIILVVAVMLVSLVFDISDVIRYAMGERM
jgi:hypothetical protein